MGFFQKVVESWNLEILNYVDMSFFQKAVEWLLLFLEKLEMFNFVDMGFFQKAVELNPLDATSRHVLGVW